MSTALRSPESAADRPWRFGKELNGYVRDGELRYINVGRGTKKLRRKFTDPDLDELVERRAKREVPCRSTSTKIAVLSLRLSIQS